MQWQTECYILLRLLQAFSIEKWRGRKKSEECAVMYRQVPYCTFGRMMSKLANQPTNITRHLQEYRFFGRYRRGWICVPHKNEKAEAW